MQKVAIVLIIAISLFGIIYSQSLLAPKISCPVADDNGAVLEFTLAGENAETLETERGIFIRYIIPTGGYIGDVGSPQIPVWSTLVAMPPTSGVSAEIIECEWDTLRNVLLYPVQNRDNSQGFDYNEAAYRRGIYPARVIDVGEPAIMRDFRVAPINFYPFRYDAKSKILYIARKMTVRVNFDGTDNRNTKSDSPYISEAFEPLYRSVIANYWFYRREKQLRRGTILYIISDAFADDFEPLLQWKMREGCRVRMALAYEDVGGGDVPSSDDIYNYIHDAYYTWEYPPDYVVLCGDVVMGGTYLPSYQYYSGLLGEYYTSDHQYSLMAGDDYLADIMVGRISIDLETEAQTYSAKVVQYEGYPRDGGSDWFRRGMVVSANCCGSPQPSTPRRVGLWVRELALRNGYDEIDTFFCYGTDCPRGASEMSDYINSGVSFINYRGWGGSAGWDFPSFYVGDVLGLSNTNMFPFVTSIVCGTGDFDSPTTDPCFGEAWIRAGTPTNPRGAIDFYGPTDHDTHTKWNNPNCEGFYWGLFEENLSTFGQCALRGKLTLHLSYPQNRGVGDGVEHYNYVYNVLGDPSVRLWRKFPYLITVSKPDEIHRGETRITVDVSRDSNPVEGALVSVWFPIWEGDGDPYTAFTDENGNATVSFPASETEDNDSVSLVITHRGYNPDVSYIPIVSADSFVALQRCILDDDTMGESDGNSDSIPSPGETIELRLTLKNEGISAITNITAEIIGDSSFDIITGSVSIGDIDSGEQVSSTEPIVIRLHSDIEDSSEIPLKFVSSYDGGSDTSAYTITVCSPKIEVDSVMPIGDGILSPGENTEIAIFLKNLGSVSTREANISLSGGCRVSLGVDSASVSAISPGSSSEIIPNIEITADTGLINGIIDRITLTFDDGFYHREIAVPILIGQITGSTFGGPDTFGYFCYDNTDIESGRAPTYDWLEISPIYGGDGIDLELGDDETKLVALPFDFVYYGRTYDTIAVCSNGWLGMGNVDTEIYNNFYNRPLPDPSGPWGMICPFWDDLEPTVNESLGVYYKYIEDEHIFVIEWITVNANDDFTPEWFEAILRDPNYYTALYGFGEILFQYKKISDIDSLAGDPNALAEYSTIGIEDPTKTVAIQYKYCGELAPYAADVDSGRAILFSTNPPVAIDTSKIESFSEKPYNLDVRLIPNPFNPVQTITVDLPENTNISVDVIDISGKIVRNISSGNFKNGRHTFIWNGDDNSGKNLPSGIYFVRVVYLDGSRRIVRKSLMIR